MDWIKVLYVIAIAAPPILLALTWWGWLRDRHISAPKWRTILFFSGLFAATSNFLLWWAWVIWLRFHSTPTSWKVRDVASDIGLALLLYSVMAAIAGKGRYRLLLGVSGLLASLPWIPLGVL